MGLGIVVGMLAELRDEDPEGVEYWRAEFAKLNQLLAEHGLPQHDEPEVLPALDNRCSLLSYPYSFLHHLRRVYAHRIADPSWVVTPVANGQRAAGDSVVESATMQMNSHLLCHSDAEGFYLPLDFQPVLFDERGDIPGGMVGSSYRLIDELLFVAPALGIQLRGRELPDEEADAINSDADAQRGDLWIERIVWLSLFEAARISVRHKAAICFS